MVDAIATVAPAAYVAAAPTVEATAFAVAGGSAPARSTSRASTAEAEFLGLRFSLADRPKVLQAIAARAPAKRFAYVVTPNVDHVVRLQRQRSDLWPAYRHAWLTLCDSRILCHLASRSGLSLPVVPGSDLTATLFDQVIHPNERIAIVGSDADAAETLRQRFGLANVAHHVPPMGFIADPVEVDRAAAFVADAKARYVFLALGSPQQEMLAYRVARLGQATGIGLCIGASLDFLTGRQTRAPELMQQLSLEWLYRLASQPQRLWRRYLVDGPTVFSIYRHWQHDFA